jgi:hypothetical protein
VRLQQRPQAAIAGRLADQGECLAPDENGVPAAVVGVDGHHDRATSLRSRLEQRPDHRARDERLVAQGDEDRGRLRADGLEADLHRARQPAIRFGVDDTPGGAPVDRRLDAIGVVAQHDDRLPHPGLAERVEHVLKDRPAADRCEQLAATKT